MLEMNGLPGAWQPAVKPLMQAFVSACHVVRSDQLIPLAP
jgi:hypothetical protein